MIVIAIIGILAAIAVPNFRRAREQARQNKCYEFSSLLTRTAELYELERKQRPGVVEDLAPFLSGNRIPTCPTSGKYEFFDKGGIFRPVICGQHGCASATWGG